jgi:hypothetical protein
MFFVLGKETWTHILTREGPWDPLGAMAWCVWTAFATLAGLGIIRPLKMLPIVFLEIFYKILWLILVAYPLWSKGTLTGSPAEGITSEFLWVLLPIVSPGATLLSPTSTIRRSREHSLEKAAEAYDRMIQGHAPVPHRLTQ